MESQFAERQLWKFGESGPHLPRLQADLAAVRSIATNFDLARQLEMNAGSFAAKFDIKGE